MEAYAKHPATFTPLAMTLPCSALDSSINQVLNIQLLELNSHLLTRTELIVIRKLPWFWRKVCFQLSLLEYAASLTHQKLGHVPQYDSTHEKWLIRADPLSLGWNARRRKVLNVGELPNRITISEIQRKPLLKKKRFRPKPSRSRNHWTATLWVVERSKLKRTKTQ